MLSMSDEWTFSIKSLANQFGVETSTIQARITELKEKGYIQTKRQREKGGRFSSCAWDIFEAPPRSENSTCGENHTRKKPHDENTTCGIHHVRKKQHVKNINIKEHQDIKNIKSKEESARFIRPTLEEVASYCEERKNNVDPQRFIDYYTANGWKVGRNPMKDWKAAVRTWERGGKPAGHCQPKDEPEEIDWDEMARELEEKYRREGKPT
jgi:DNA-binding transcriptional MocR family regulator